MRSRLVFCVLAALSSSLHVRSATAASGDYSDYEDLSADVLTCEEAVAALADCCPGFEPHQIRCVDHAYRETSACTGNVSEGHERPSLDPTTSKCIREMSCDALVASNTCARASLRYALPRSTDAGALAGACL